MKNNLCVLLLSTIFLLFSCNKKEKNITQKKIDFRTLADTVSLSPSDVVAPVLDETQDEHQYYSAVYQLNDATRAIMTTEILEYIHAQMEYKTNNPSDDEATVIYYEDLFLEFPTLESQINTHLTNTDYGLTYEYDDFESIADALVWKEELESPAIWIMLFEDLPASFSPNVSDYIMAAPIQIDLEDIDSEDRIFAWEYTNGEVATISIGETMARERTKGIRFGQKPVIGAGGSRKKGTEFDPKPPYVNTNPPFTGSSNPWSSGNAAKINRIKIYQRFDRNKHSEVRLAVMAGTHTGTYINHSSNGNKEYVVDVHKDDIGNDIWVYPRMICNMLDWQDDKIYVYNLFEHDWFVTADNRYLGGLVNTSTGQWTTRMWSRSEHTNEVYITPIDDNHQRNLNARIAHPVCITIQSNGNIVHTGSQGNALISFY